VVNKAVQESCFRPTQPKMSTLGAIVCSRVVAARLGHLLLGRKWRGLILFATIVAMFLMGIAMQGEFFSTSSGSYLQDLGYFGELGRVASRWPQRVLRLRG